MNTRPLYQVATEDFRIIPLNAVGLLDQENGLYDDNWIVSAGDLFGQMDLSMSLIDYDPYADKAA